MLIMRIQLTAQSFGWSDKSKVRILYVTLTVLLMIMIQDNKLAQVLQTHQKLLKKECPISIARVLAARYRCILEVVIHSLPHLSTERISL